MSGTDISYRRHFEQFWPSGRADLHFAAHSHHLWPDVSRAAHEQAWADAARLWDGKWGPIFDELLPDCRAHIARLLHLSDPRTIAFAPNTHEFVLRLLSCFDDATGASGGAPTGGMPSSSPGSPLRILTTDSEFHSFRRQALRLEEAGRAQLDVVPTEPFATFEERFGQAAEAGGHDLVYVSQVFFNSGFVFDSLDDVVRRVPSEHTLVVVDGYHGFMAKPTDLSAIEDRAFYLAGGYKYAMSGEGACFMHCPEGYASAPVNTGWFASFGELADVGSNGGVGFSSDGFRMFGSTFDPAGLYRFRAVMDWLQQIGVDPDVIHERVRGLQGDFLGRLAALELPWLSPRELIPDASHADRGNFLAFRTPRAAEIQSALEREGVVTDHRGDILRFGFGLYHDPGDVEELVRRLSRLGSIIGAD